MLGHSCHAYNLCSVWVCWARGQNSHYNMSINQTHAQSKINEWYIGENQMLLLFIIIIIVILSKVKVKRKFN